MYNFYLISINQAKYDAACVRIKEHVKDSKTVLNAVYTKSKHGHDRGCYESHMKAYNQFLDSTDDQYMVVFEDDVMFSKDITLTYYIDLINTIDPEFNAFYLGHRLRFYLDCSYKKITDDVYSVRTYDLHAIILNRPFVERLCSEYPKYTGTPIDMVIKNICDHKTYAIYPMVAYQEGLNGRIELLYEKCMTYNKEPVNTAICSIVIFSLIAVFLLAFLLYDIYNPEISNRTNL